MLTVFNNTKFLKKISKRISAICSTLPFVFLFLDSPGNNTGVGCYSFSRGSSGPRDRTRSLALPADSLPSEPPGKPLSVPSLQTERAVVRTVSIMVHGPGYDFFKEVWSGSCLLCTLSYGELRTRTVGLTVPLERRELGLEIVGKLIFMFLWVESSKTQNENEFISRLFHYVKFWISHPTMKNVPAAPTVSGYHRGLT